MSANATDADIDRIERIEWRTTVNQFIQFEKRTQSATMATFRVSYLAFNLGSHSIQCTEELIIIIIT